MTDASGASTGTLAWPDHAEIERLGARFAWALDLHDYEALRELFAAGAHYVSVGREFTGVEDLIASFRARPPGRVTRHGLGNLLLTPRADGSVAGRGSWHTFASHGPPAAGIGIYMVADFRDVYVPTPQGWRIAERVITPVFREPALAPRD